MLLLEYFDSLADDSRTMRERRIRVKRFDTFAGPGLKLAKLSRELIAKWRRELARTVSSKSVTSYVSEVHWLWRRAAKAGLAPPIGSTADGQQHRRAFRIPEPEWLAPLPQEITLETPLPRVVELYVFPLNLKIQRDESRKNTRAGVRDLADFLGRIPLVSDLTDDTLIATINWFRSRNTPPATINHRIGRLKAIWNFLAKRGIVRKWPTVGKLAEPQRIPKAWTIDQLRKLYDACGEQTYPMHGVPGALWWQSIISAAWDSGERSGALLQARWEHLNESGFLRIPAELRKGGRKIGEYQLSPHTMAQLTELRKHSRSQEIWPSGNRSTVWKRFNRILASAGLPTDRFSKFHRVRRTVASYAELRGMNATELLGHTDRSTTLASYIDRSIAKPKQAVDVLPSILAVATEGPQLVAVPSPVAPDLSGLVTLIQQQQQQIAALTALLQKGGAA